MARYLVTNYRKQRVMKRFLMLLVLLAFSSAVLKAQDDELPPPSSHPQPQTIDLTGKQNIHLNTGKKVDLSNYLIEPGLHVSFMQGGFNIGVSPYLGYRIWKNLYAGAGLTYLYTAYRNIGYADAGGAVHYTNASGHTYGGGVFFQYNIWKGFFVRDRFEVLHRTMDGVYDATISVNPQTNETVINMPKVQKTIPDMMIGAGYNMLQAKNIFLPVMFSYNALYSVTDKLYSVYPHGWVVQVGFVDIF